MYYLRLSKCKLLVFPYIVIYIKQKQTVVYKRLRKIHYVWVYKSIKSCYALRVFRICKICPALFVYMSIKP